MAHIRIEQGIVEGSEMSGVHAFLGIPYAAAPIGDRRWQPPQPPDAWKGVRNARVACYPSDTNLVVLQQLASQSIGTHNLGRQRGLLLEQTQLITEQRLLQSHIEQLDQEIADIIGGSREGKILTSIPRGMSRRIKRSLPLIAASGQKFKPH